MRWLEAVLPDHVISFILARKTGGLRRDECLPPPSDPVPQEKPPAMFDDVKGFHLPRDVDVPAAYEDSYCCDERQGVAAIADGVAAGIFSDRWADILTSAVAAAPPDLDDAEGFRVWLADCRTQWSQGIDFSNLGYFHRRKLSQVGGGYATLLWLELSPAGDKDLQDAGAFRCVAAAAGDCCLFHVRDCRLLKTFPIAASEEFGLQPKSIGSSDLGEDELLKFERWEDSCRSGDLFVLASDAIACSLMESLEAGESVDWERLALMDETAWSDWILRLRAEDRIRFDDTTMVLLTVGEPTRLVVLHEPLAAEGGQESLEGRAQSDAILSRESDAPAAAPAPPIGEDAFQAPTLAADDAWNSGDRWTQAAGAGRPDSDIARDSSAAEGVPSRDEGEQAP